MPSLDDYPIGSDRPALSTPPPESDSRRVWGVVAVVILIVAAAIAFYVTRPSSGPGAADTAANKPAAATDVAADRKPLGPDVPARELPPLDETDPIVRELIRALSSRPEVTRWLATDGLIRNIVASVDAVANGGTPAAQLRTLAPSRPFAVTSRGDQTVIDPRSYERYDGIAHTVGAIDADGIARVYATLRPRLQEAYRELGYPDANFDAAVERAIGRLVDTPRVAADVRVQQAPVLYQYADPKIEQLTAAQKQLIRMGPRNQQIIQDKLRDVAKALGIS